MSIIFNKMFYSVLFLRLDKSLPAYLLIPEFLVAALHRYTLAQHYMTGEVDT